MMLVLIGGALFLFVTIYQRNQVKTVLGGCSAGAMHLPVQDEVVQVTKDGDTLTLLTKVKNNKQQVLVVDYCTGKMVRSIHVYAGQATDEIPLGEVPAKSQNDSGNIATKPRVDIIVKDANIP